VDLRTPPVPNAVDVLSLDNLQQIALFDMADLDETTVKKHHKWRMECNSFRASLPLDSSTDVTGGITVAIHINTKFCSECKVNIQI
jgi:hypothetical protein